MSAHEVYESEEQRTLKQNKAMHLWFSQVSDFLNDAGMDMRACLKPDVEIPWTPESVKNHLWRPIQEIMLDKESTTECSTTDPSAICMVITRHFAEKHGMTLPEFPSRFTAVNSVEGK